MQMNENAETNWTFTWHNSSTEVKNYYKMVKMEIINGKIVK